MSYGIMVQAFFDPVGAISADPIYTLNILEKEEPDADPPLIVTLSAVPVLHNWNTDDPKAPIKGSSLSFSIVVNSLSGFSLTDFIAENEDEFKVQLYWGEQLMFEGFLILGEDDTTEIMVDYNHEINLTATDGLGLLKDIALDKAKVTYTEIADINDVWSSTAPHTLTVPSGFAAGVQIGDVIHIHTAIPIADIYYTVTGISAAPDLEVAETVTTGSVSASDITDLRPVLFEDKITILQILDKCLAATGLELNTRIFCNFLEENADLTKCFIEQTLLNPQTFLKDGTNYNDYKDCYTVLEYILNKYRCTLSQAKGKWQIVHWDELRYSGYAIPGFEYDSDFTLVDAIKLNYESSSPIFAGFNKFQIGIGEDTVAETGLLHKVLRPFKFDKETFNFKPPAQLLRNFDLQQLGRLINTSTTGSGVTLQTIREYEVVWWVDDIYLAHAGTPPPPVHIIRVISDFLDNEIERYLVLGNTTTWLDSYRIEATQGDILNVSLTERTAASNTNGVITVFILLDSGTDHKYLTPTGWVVGQAPYENTVVGDTDEWNNFTTDAFKYPVPNDGLLYIILFPEQDSFNVLITGETHIRDIRLDYNYWINQSTKIVGQTHKNEQLGTIKNSNELEIFVDDSPRNSLAGTLFLPTLNGIIQARTVSWFLADATNPHRIGQLTTFEMEFWRRKVRTVLEGTFVGLISPDTLGDHVSMLSVFNYTFFSGLDFIAGNMEIDYRNNKWTGTLWEIYDGTEVDADLSSSYEFKYLYAPK